MKILSVFIMWSYSIKGEPHMGYDYMILLGLIMNHIIQTNCFKFLSQFFGNWLMHDILSMRNSLSLIWKRHTDHCFCAFNIHFSFLQLSYCHNLTKEQESLVDKLISDEKLKNKYKRYGICKTCTRSSYLASKKGENVKNKTKLTSEKNERERIK